MKLAVTLFALACVALVCADVVDRKDFVLQDAMIEKINSNPVNTWVAGRNEKFEGWTVNDVKSLLLPSYTRPGTKYPLTVLRGDTPIPNSFDSRQNFSGCIHPIRDQGQCGSCWAFGAAESFSDRLCIASKGATNVVLSPQDLVSCDHTNDGCNGGIPVDAWQYMASKGLVTDSCLPYESGKGHVPLCPLFRKCKDGSEWNPYKVDESSIVTLNQVDSIQRAVMTDGPVEAAFTVYQDFMSYKSGVYVHTTGDMLGGHAVKIIGWGVDSSTNQDYWIVANSWSTTWGMEGYFNILRGVDECGIEAGVVCGKPAL